MAHRAGISMKEQAGLPRFTKKCQINDVEPTSDFSYRQLGTEHPTLAWPMSGLGRVRLAQGRLDETIVVFEEVLALCHDIRCQGSKDVPLALAKLGLAQAAAMAR